jgi:glycosyltransferase involved in cell wall biosynthesis
LAEDLQLKTDAAEIDDSELSAEGLPPSVSVIIPAYNVAPYIGETLDSVFAQSFKNLEVIVVNDGSPDTEEFERAIAPYRDRIRYLKQENRGASVARNTGLHAARGEFVAFLDADDLWLPNYLEEQMKFIRERGCDLVCADASYFGDPSLAHQTYMQSLMETAPSTGDVTFLQLLNAEQHLITSGIVARRQPIMDVGEFDVTLPNSQDFDLWLRLVRSGARLSYHKDVLLKYRCRQDGLTGDRGNTLRRELRIFDKIEQTYDLSPTERAKAIPVIRDHRALTEFELGKLHLTKGQFKEARSAFARANQHRPSLKKSAALWLTRLAPRVMQTICLRRM